MKKVVTTVVLGCALLAASGTANAQQDRGVEPRWGIRPERRQSSTPLDFARWLARRLNEADAVPAPPPAVQPPKSSPAPDRGPNDGELICPPERAHCPVG